MFDRLIVAVGHNPGKEHLFTGEERMEMAKTLVAELVKREPNEAKIEVLGFSGLTVDFATEMNASALLRGIRNLSDLQNEVQQALTNREVAGLETAFVVAGQSFAYTSSSLIKQITAMGRDLDSLGTMCPPMVVDRLRIKRDENPPILQQMLETD